MNNSITGFRGVLALIVVLFHIYKSAVAEKWIESLNFPMLERMGNAAVVLFFVISGYLIIKTLNSKNDLKYFWLDRILRIYPVFLVIHLIVFLVGPFINYKIFAGITFQEYWFHFFSNLFLLPGIFELPIVQLVAWSLSYEMLFYIISSIIYFSIKKKYRFLTTLCILLSIVIICYRPRTIYFTMGVVIFYLENKLPSIRYKKIYSILWILLFITFLSYYRAYSRFYLVFVSFFLFFIIVKQIGIISKILQIKPIMFLGRISYSLYMWHTFIMFPFKIIMNKFNLPFFFYTILVIVSSIIASYISYILIEEKLTQKIKVILYKLPQSDNSYENITIKNENI